MENLKKYWNDRYLSEDTGWDVGYITTPVKEYIDGLKDKTIKILIPGAGNSYEAEYLFRNGFENVFVLDIAASPLNNLKKRVPGFPEDHLICKDFFELQGHYDLILEQTFFCAIDPALRKKYAEKMYDLLQPNGKLVGVLFDDKLNSDKPPYGGSKEEYISYFRSLFDIRYFEKCYNSILPRAGKELFITLEKKKN